MLQWLQMPFITVVIPAFNHERFIAEAIESVLGQTIRDWELIVVDDGSTDGTANIVRQYEDPRISLLRQSNSGAHAALNRGINEAKGHWIAFLNSDDRFRPDKLERHLQAHEADPHLEASASRVRYIGSSGAPVKGYSYYALRYRSMRRMARRAHSLFSSLVAENHLITTSSLFAKRDTLLEVGGFADFRYIHDWSMFLSLAARRKFVVIEEELSDYRRHVGNTIREDDATGQIEDNIALAWQISTFMEHDPSEDEVNAVFLDLNRNPRVDFELFSLLSLWRLRSAGEVSSVTALLGGQNEWLLQHCYDKVYRRRIRNYVRRLVQKIRLLGEIWRYDYDQHDNV